MLSIATFVQSYWLTQSLNTSTDYDLESFRESYIELKRIRKVFAYIICLLSLVTYKLFYKEFFVFNLKVKQFVESESGPQHAKLLLPIEFDYLNRNACFACIPHNTSLSNEILLQLSADPTQLHLDLSHDDSIKKHFSLIKSSAKARISQIDDLKAKANQYAKNRATKSMLSSSYTLGGGSSHVGGSDGFNDLNIMAVGGSGSSGAGGTKSVPYLGRFMPSKKIESMTSTSFKCFLLES